MDRSRMEELFPTLSRVAGAVGRAGHVVLRLSGRFLRRAWKPVLIVLASLALLHTLGVVVTGRMVASELAKVRTLGYATSRRELLPCRAQLSQGERQAARQFAQVTSMMRRSKLAPHYESYGMHSLLGFEETVSDEAWREANDHARRFKAVADAAAQIDWKHVGATVRSEDQANDLYWNLQDLRDGLLCDAIVETLAGNTKGAASLLRLALQVSEAQSSVPSSSFWPDLSSATRTRNVLMRIASLAQLAPIQFTEAPLCA